VQFEDHLETEIEKELLELMRVQEEMNTAESRSSKKQEEDGALSDEAQQHS
jgi:hypothetical protein